MDNNGHQVKQFYRTLYNVVDFKGNLEHTVDMGKEFLSADEAAELLKLHPRTIRRLLASGELPGTRLGRQWRIADATLRAFIDNGGKKTPPAKKK